MNVTRQRQKYTPRVLKFAGQVLFTMWQHQELRDVYKKHGWKEHDFVTKTVAARNAGPNSPSNANSTLNRPMASQGGTRYEDRTVQRVTQNASGPSVSASINQSARSPAAAPAAPAPPGIYHRVRTNFISIYLFTLINFVKCGSFLFVRKKKLYIFIF